MLVGRWVRHRRPWTFRAVRDDPSAANRRSADAVDERRNPHLDASRQSPHDSASATSRRTTCEPEHATDSASSA